MPVKKHREKKVPGNILRDFVQKYKLLIRPYVAQGNFEYSAQQMNDECTNYQDFRVGFRKKVGTTAYNSYKKAISIFSGLLDRSVCDVKEDFANPEKRKTLLGVLDREMKIIDSEMRRIKDRDYLKAGRLAIERTAAS